ncbi:MAG: 3D domain-containing protein [Desulfosporosinus sp.]|nr:3D domain-containing protein [Desulfosporosinus sp.]
MIIQNSSPGSAKVDVDLSKLNISKTLTVEATAYTYTGNNTATGVKPREGLIAVDPKVIAMGSQVYVEGYGYAIAADTGGSIRGNRIDVFSLPSVNVLTGDESQSKFISLVPYNGKFF